MRKVDDGEKKKEEKKKEKKRKKKIMTFIVATTSLPVHRPNADRLERRTLVPKECRMYTREKSPVVCF